MLLINKSVFSFLFIMLPVLTIGQEAGNISISTSKSFEIQKDSSYYFEIPVAIVQDDKEDLFFCNENSIAKFNSNGELLLLRKPYGRGPGELMAVRDCTIESDYLVVYDDEKRENIWFQKSDLAFVTSMKVRKNRARYIEGIDSLVYSLNKSSFGFQTNSLSKFNINTKLEEMIDYKVPKYAFIGATRNGGGMTSSENGKVYYGFLPYSAIWEYDPVTDVTNEINVTTEDYVGVKEKELKGIQDDHLEHIRYSFSISRLTGIFFIEPNLIVRMIEHGNPWAREEVNIILDFITDDGELVGREKVENRIAFVSGNKIFIQQDWDMTLQNYDRMRNGEKMEIFNVLEIR